MFDYMSYSQIAALFLGIAFTVISIATTFLAVKYAKKLKSFIKTIFFTLTAPFIACIGWLFLIFSFIQGLRNDDLLNLIVSIILSLFICAMVITVAKALYNKHSDLDEDEENENAQVTEDTTEQATVEEESLEKQSDEQARIEDKKAPLLLAHTPENEDEIVVDESTEVEEPAQEESEEESVEANETEEVEENVEVEESAEAEEPTQKQENTEDDDSTDNEDLTEDEEFEKFLEELRKKVEDNPDGDDENK